MDASSEKMPPSMRRMSESEYFTGDTRKDIHSSEPSLCMQIHTVLHMGSLIQAFVLHWNIL